MALYGGITLPGQPDLENIRRLDLLPIPMVRRIHRYGIAIDREYLYSLSSELDAEMTSLQRDISSYIPPSSLDDFTARSIDIDEDPTINANSADQIRNLLFSVLHVGRDKQLKTTSTGKISTGKKQLELVKEDHPVVQKILQYRERAKLKTTYADTLPRRAQLHPRGSCCPVCELGHSADTYRVHTEFLLTRTETGRFASKNPNLQNIPVRSELGRRLRAAFVASPGTRFVSVDFCVAPETKILTENLRWLRADCLQPGQSIIGFDEDVQNGRTGAKFRKSVVEAISIVKRKSVRVVTDRGSIIASTNHPFCVRKTDKSGGEPTRRWVCAGDLCVGDDMTFTAQPWKDDLSRDGGYLAGVLDGEGYVSCQLLAFGQQISSPVYAEFIRILDNKGYSIGGHGYRFSNFSLTKKTGKQYAPVGRIFVKGMWESLRLLGSCRPTRLLPKASNLWQDRRTWGKSTLSAKVLAVEWVGERTLVAIQTSTKTYISNGFLSHNSQIELRDLAHLSRAESMMRVYQQDGDIHVATAIGCFGISDPDKVDPYLHRLPSKTVNFAIVYGITSKALSSQLALQGVLWTEEESDGFIRKWFDLYPEVRSYMELQWYRARRYGFVWDAFGRIRHVPEVRSCHSYIRSAGLRQAGNVPEQATSAGQTKLVMGELQEDFDNLTSSGVWVWPLLTIHDQLIAEVEENAAEGVKDLMMERFNNVMVDKDTGKDYWRVPIKSDGKITERWQ